MPACTRGDRRRPEDRAETASHHAGIRVLTPFRGVHAVRDKLMDEAHALLDGRGVPDIGPSCT
ncbi:hypothetical protein GCM10018963_62510 [Saccharothrix longispora]